MASSLHESQSLDRATRPRRRSTPSCTVTFSGTSKSGTSSLIYRLAYDRWRKGDSSAFSVPDPVFFRVADRIDILLEDVTHMEAVYPAMRHSSVSNSIVRVFVFALDDNTLAKNFGDALNRVREEDEMMSAAELQHFARRSLFVFTKTDNETARNANLWTCQQALTQAGGMALLPEDTQPGALSARLLYIDCSSLNGENVELVRAFLRQMALDAQATVHDNDISPRYLLSPHEVEPESAAASAAKVHSFHLEHRPGCLLL